MTDVRYRARIKGVKNPHSFCITCIHSSLYRPEGDVRAYIGDFVPFRRRRGLRRTERERLLGKEVFR